nr:VCBS repeat-containing protein [Flammeovirgaceae bacterium]
EDKDGDLDLYLVREESNEVEFYRNNNGLFNRSLVNLSFESNFFVYNINLRDFDSDGDLDFLIYGIASFSPYYSSQIRIYQNNGNGSYDEIPTLLSVYGIYDYDWVDCDQDGDLDIVGRDHYIQDSYDFSILFDKPKNSFSNFSRKGTTGLGSWSDFNRDGLSDFLQHGYRFNNGAYYFTTKIYKQTEFGIFQDINENLPDKLYGEWFDYDGDGDVDISSETYFINNGNESFSNSGIRAPEYPRSINGNTNIITTLDFNGDGHLDFFTKDGKLFINTSNKIKPKPETPTNLNAEVNSKSALLTWGDVGKDNEVYNLYIRKGNETIFSSESNRNTGYPLITKNQLKYKDYSSGLKVSDPLRPKGNVGTAPIFRAQELTPGTYHWSVQTVGSGQLTSKFAGEGSFTIENEIEEEEDQMYEAEEHYVVETDFGVKSAVSEFSSPVYDDGTGSAVAIFDKGDEFKIDFDIPSSGNYTLKLRVRSGHTYNSMAYWPNGYLFKLDNNDISLNGDPGSVSDFSSHYGGAYWGDMISESIQFSEGSHSLSIKANGNWGAIDYLIVERINSSASSRIANNGLLTTQESGLEEISLYPNPTQHILNISYSSGTLGRYDIKVLDLTGKEMYSTILEKQEKTNIASLDISQFKPGIYLMVITNNDTKIVRKFLKK